ncbi:MAG TPA: GspH/FimT family protein [Steroidobacteraceae bacterium]|nr:GspH/FimT family protein [Steroidobacteraceae bacterium]
MGVRKNRGLTLLELCVVLALVALLASVAAPTFLSASRNAAVRSAFFELAAGLQLARASAIVQAQRGTLCLSASLEGACLSDGGTNAWTAFLVVDGKSLPLASRTLPAGVVLRATRNRIDFWPDSRAASTGTLTICDTLGVARPRSLVVSQLGRIRVAEGTASGCRA